MLNPLYNAIARAIVAIHVVLSQVLGTSGWSWALAIILLTVGVRLVLFPLFVKQIKAQRTMQLMQPKIREIRERHKHDKQKMNEEVLKLQREHGNPLLGCLPILVQIPLFFALFHTLDGVVPKHTKGSYVPSGSVGLSPASANSMAHAHIFGTSLASSFTSSTAILHYLGSGAIATKVVTVLLIVIMMATTFITQKQIFGRNATMDPSQAKQQKILLYLSPLMLGVFGFRFPVGVLLYWFTTNVWSMGQQYVVLRRMPPPGSPVVVAAKRPSRFFPRPVTATGVVAEVAPASLPVEPRAVVPGRAGSLPTDSERRPTTTPRRAGGPPNRPPRRRSKSGRRGGRR